MSSLLKPDQTHNVAMALPIAKFVLSLGSDGRVVSQGPAEEVLRKDDALQHRVEEAEQIDEKTEEVIDPASEIKAMPGAGKLVVAEELAEGHVRWPASRFPSAIFQFSHKLD